MASIYLVASFVCLVPVPQFVFGQIGSLEGDVEQYVLTREVFTFAFMGIFLLLVVLLARLIFRSKEPRKQTGHGGPVSPSTTITSETATSTEDTPPQPKCQRSVRPTRVLGVVFVICSIPLVCLGTYLTVVIIGHAVELRQEIHELRREKLPPPTLTGSYSGDAFADRLREIQWREESLRNDIVWGAIFTVAIAIVMFLCGWLISRWIRQAARGGRQVLARKPRRWIDSRSSETTE